MTHLAEHAAVRAGDALDSQHRAVGVEALIHGGHAGQIHILGSNLTVAQHGVQHLLRSHKAALAVADGNGVHLAHLALAEPRAAGGSHTGVHQHTLVTADGVEGQGGVAGGDGADIAVGHQTQLDQSLEAVADAQHQAIALLQQTAHSLGDRRVAARRRRRSRRAA